ncbi:thioredoxin [Lacimicrobium sp. SS2-24]|uniref:TlpA family protein disulfide reductase n=1 Tax=Lacimicrobium sp. SS2-24 TaxID=2005569 RepID=UPI001130623A|nr:thioredoxin [Lacimicrobium sp. SS2-24]
MRHFFLFLLGGLCLTACVSAHNGEAALGPITGGQLRSQFAEFEQAYQRFQPGPRELEAMQALKGKSVLVFLGTWCHDSQREVPRLLKLLDVSGVEIEALQLIAVGLDKRDPQGLAQQFNLLYTPTIIIKDDTREQYRMVERPAGELALVLQSGVMEAEEQDHDTKKQ